MPTDDRGTFQNPALSCREVVQKSANFKAGYSWIRNSNQHTKLVYCTATTQCCDEDGGWMRIAYLDMTNLDHKCPSGFDIITSPKRACIRRSTPGCTSVSFSTHGVEYTRVCGRVRAYQKATPDAFAPYYISRHNIDNVYVDGVSITQGHPRRHIWTFAAGYIEGAYDQYSCPCARSDHTYIGTVPPYIGNDYYCESGSSLPSYSFEYFPDDPLWDGMDCPYYNTCCTRRNPPYFCKQVVASSNAIEMRVCTDQYSGDEDILLELVELFVQ